MSQKNVFIDGSSLTRQKRILTKGYVSFYQQANLDFEILLEYFCANLDEIFKFRKERLLKNFEKWPKTLYQIFENDSRLAISDVYIQHTLIL